MAATKKKRKDPVRDDRQVWFKGFLVEQMCQSHQILREKNSEIALFNRDNVGGAGLQQVAKI